MNRLVVPISIAVLLFIMIAAFRMRRRCCCQYGVCSRCIKETFANKSEVPSFYKIQPIFPKITEKKVFLKKVLL